MNKSASAARVAHELKIEFIVQGPLLVHSTAIGPWGLDAVAMRNADGHLVISGDAIIGKLREAFDHIGHDPFVTETDTVKSRAKVISDNRRRSDDSQSHESFKKEQLQADPDQRYPLFVSDAISVAPWPVAGRHTLSSVAINDELQTAEDRMLRKMDCPIRPGQLAAFECTMRYFCDSLKGTEEVDKLIRGALNWIVSFGSQKSVGFGILKSVRFVNRSYTTFASSSHVSAPLLDDHHPVTLIDWTFDDPVCVPKGVVNGNVFETQQFIPGEALRGATAALLQKILGLSPKTDLSTIPIDHSFGYLSHYFDRVRITRAYLRCLAEPTNHRAPVAPLSLCFRGAELLDAASLTEEQMAFILSSNQNVYEPLAFAPDWKTPESQEVDCRLGIRYAADELRVRTQINTDLRRAEDSNLFAYRMLRPEGMAWRGTVSIDPRNAAGVVDLTAYECQLIAGQFASLIESGWLQVGKTKARGRGRLVLTPRNLFTFKAVRGRQTGKSDVTILLRGPALIVDPRQCVSVDGIRKSTAEIDQKYSDYWHQISDGSLEEIVARRYKEDDEIGGYLAWLYRYGGGDAAYNPAFLCATGSTFGLRIRDWDRARQHLQSWLMYGLPIPEWAREAYGNNFRTNPYLPQNGYGEIEIDWQLPRAQREPL